MIVGWITFKAIWHIFSSHKFYDEYDLTVYKLQEWSKAIYSHLSEEGT